MIRHNFKKEYGQNFLVSKSFAKELVDTLELNDNDTVIEIGPGDGMITNIILNSSSAKLFAFEIDYDLLPNLVKRFSTFKNFKLVHKDILSLDLNSFIEENDIKGDIKIIGALPYNISKKIIDNFLKYSQEVNNNSKISILSFIIQEEVAKDYIAKAPQSSFLSNYIQFFGDARKFKSIPNHKFYPMPKVNGAIIQIKLNKEISKNYLEEKKLIRMGFSSPRKMLIRNLKNIKEYNGIDFLSVFQEIGVNDKARPAELIHEQWKQLYEKLSKLI